MTSNHYSFHCSKLQQAFLEARPVIESYRDNLDHISEDIKMLESFLSDQQIKRRLHCPVYYEVSVGGGSMYTEEAFESDAQGNLKENISNTPGAIHQYSLVWDEVEWPGGKKRFRLQYELTHIQGTLGLNEKGLPYIETPKERSTERLALIESPIEIRLHYKKHLPTFLEYVSRELR